VITCYDIQFTDSDVLDLLTSLDASKACGIDSLSPKLFKFCAAPLLQIICHLFHTSISFSTIPLDFRTHCVVPVFKTGDKSSNYRPISLLCILSKVLERIVYNNLIDCVRKRSSKHQFSFLPNRSTLQQLLMFADKVLESKCEVDVAYMDFKKASDSVSHNHLLKVNYWSSIIWDIYKVNGNAIKSLQHHEGLGVKFLTNFSWTAHYSKIITKVYQMLGLVRRKFSVNAKKQLYIALVRSQLQYCSINLMEASTYKGHHQNRTYPT